MLRKVQHNHWETTYFPEVFRCPSLDNLKFSSNFPERTNHVTYGLNAATGRSTRISIVAPHTGCYTFTVSGGTSQAWYGITVHTKYYAFDAENQACFFRTQTVYMPGKDLGNPKLKINMRVFAQSHTRRINDAPPVSVVRNPLSETDLPDGIVKVEFSEYKASGTYTQDFYLSFPGGKNHLIFGQPERRLKKK